MVASMLRQQLWKALHFILEFYTWPTWTLCTFTSLVLILLLLQLLSATWKTSRQRAASQGKPISAEDQKQQLEFNQFQKTYLIVYYLVMFADWLQGTHMYTLYQSYGVNVGSLFLTGFLSSAVLGTCVGGLVDQLGRKWSCLLFCVLEIVINTLEHIPNFYILFLGRVLGGLSTSLLFSAFESWMVTEHKSRGFPHSWLSSTFTLASFGNGISAILAGLVAQIAADVVGEIGPFQLAIALTCVAHVYIYKYWTENYGHQPPNASPNAPPTSSLASFVDSCSVTWADPKIFSLGMGYSLFEGAVFTFVFLWVPSLLATMSDTTLPTGVVFSSFMLSVAIGAEVHDLMVEGWGVSAEILSMVICFVASVAMACASVFASRFDVLIMTFLVFEACVGAFEPCSGTCRSRYIDSGRMGTTLTLFRLPLNAIVVVGTKLTEVFPPQQVFFLSSVWLFCAFCFQGYLAWITRQGSCDVDSNVSTKKRR